MRPPGSITQYDRIPATLRALPQWVLFKLVPAPFTDWRGVTTMQTRKLPYSCFAPDEKSIDVTDARYWGTFDRCVAISRARPEFGIGFALAKGGDVTCFDLDCKDKDDFAVAMKAMGRLPPTWGEVSISGEGRHFFYRGKLPHGLQALNTFHPGFEIYCGDRFIAMTGTPLQVALPDDLTDAQKELTGLVSARDAHVYREDFTGKTYELGRSIGLSVSHVMQVMQRQKPDTHHALISGQWPRPLAGGRSETFRNVVGDLDKLCGDPDLVKEVINQSELAKLGYHGWPRSFKYWIRDARRKNNECVYPYTQVFFDDGKRLATEFLAAFARETGNALDATASATAEGNARLARELAAINQAPPPPTSTASADSWHDTHPDFRPVTLLEMPPGKLGSLCRAIEAMQPYRNVSAAVMLTFVTMSALVQRAYWVATSPDYSPNGQSRGKLAGLNMYWIGLIASAGGKESMLKTPGRILDGLAERADPARHPNGHFSLSKASNLKGPRDFASKQAMSSLMSLRPRQVSCMTEIHHRLRDLKSSEGTVRDLIPELLSMYSAADYRSTYEGTVYAKDKDSHKAVVSPSLTLFMEGIPQYFYRAISPDDLSSGFLSRCLVVDFNRNVFGSIRLDAPDDLPNDVYDNILIPIAKISLEGGFNPDAVPAPRIVRMSREAFTVYDAFDRKQAAKRMDAQNALEMFDGTGMSRVHQNAERIAALMAIAENPVEPIITQWMAEYSMRLMLSERGALRAKILTGSLGGTMSERSLAIVKLLGSMQSRVDQRITIVHKKYNLCPLRWLRNAAEMQPQHFPKDQSGTSRRAVDEAIRDVISAGIVQEVPHYSKCTGEMLEYRKALRPGGVDRADLLLIDTQALADALIAAAKDEKADIPE